MILIVSDSQTTKNTKNKKAKKMGREDAKPKQKKCVKIAELTKTKTITILTEKIQSMCDTTMSKNIAYFNILNDSVMFSFFSLFI